MGRRADSPGGVFVCVCLCGGAVSANGQETLNARGYKSTHTSTFSFSLSQTYSHNTTVLRSGKLLTSRLLSHYLGQWLVRKGEEDREKAKSSKHR